MTEKKEGILEEMKELLPEIDFENLDSMSGVFQDLTLRIKQMEEREGKLLETLKQMSIIFSENAKKLSAFEEAQEHAKNECYSLADTIVKANHQFMQVDYNALLIAMKAANPELDSQLEKVMIATAKKTAALDVFAATVAKKLQPDMDEVDWSDYVEASDVAEYVDTSDVAYAMWDNFDPTNYWDSEDIAGNFCASDIADYVDTEYVAEYVNKEEIAGNLTLDHDFHQAVAEQLSYKLLAQKGLDMELVVAEVVKTILPSLRDEVLKLFHGEGEEE